MFAEADPFLDLADGSVTRNSYEFGLGDACQKSRSEK